MRLNLILNKKNNINSLAVTTGAGLIEGISNAAIKTATQAAIDSVIIQVTTSLANSVITGNKLQLDIETIISSAISAGVLSYVNSSLGTNALTDDMNLSDYVKNATIHGVGQGISSEIRDGEFKDGFATGALISIVSDGALQMRKYQETNYDYPGKNDDKVISINRTNLTGNKSILGNNELAGAFPTLEIIDGDPKFTPGSGLTGGDVFGDRTLFGVKIDKTGFFGYVLENFSGPHDFMSSWNYQNINNQTSLINNGLLTEIGSGLLLIPATPFATGTFIQDNYQYLQNIKYFLNKNKEKKQEAINKAKENR